MSNKYQNSIEKCKKKREKELDKLIKKIEKRIERCCKKGLLETSYCSSKVDTYHDELKLYFSENGFSVKFFKYNNTKGYDGIALNWERMIG